LGVGYVDVQVRIVDAYQAFRLFAGKAQRYGAIISVS
jgi:hypothetical protein